MSPRPQSDAGFTLMEVIVALVVVSLGIAAYTMSQRNAYRAAARVKNFETTVAAARSHLENVGKDSSLSGGEFDGTYGNLTRWHLTVTALPDAKGNPLEPHASAYWIALDVSDRGGKHLFKLQTARSAP